MARTNLGGGKSLAHPWVLAVAQYSKVLWANLKKGVEGLAKRRKGGTQAFSQSSQQARLEEYLQVINMKLNLILLMERVDMADEAALDSAISELSTQVDELQAAAQAIVDKISSMPDAPDLSDEIATLQGFGTKMQDTTTALKNAAGGSETPAGTEGTEATPAPVEGEEA